MGLYSAIGRNSCIVRMRGAIKLHPCGTSADSVLKEHNFIPLSSKYPAIVQCGLTMEKYSKQVPTE